MATRDFGTIGFSFSGNVARARNLAGVARTLMGKQNEFMAHGKLPSDIRTVKLPDGSVIRLINAGGQKRIHIFSPPVVTEEGGEIEDFIFRLNPGWDVDPPYDVDKYIWMRTFTDPESVEIDLVENRPDLFPNGDIFYGKFNFSTEDATISWGDHTEHKDGLDTKQSDLNGNKYWSKLTPTSSPKIYYRGREKSSAMPTDRAGGGDFILGAFLKGVKVYVVTYSENHEYLQLFERIFNYTGFDDVIGPWTTVNEVFLAKASLLTGETDVSGLTSYMTPLIMHPDALIGHFSSMSKFTMAVHLGASTSYMASMYPDRIVNLAFDPETTEMSIASTETNPTWDEDWTDDDRSYENDINVRMLSHEIDPLEITMAKDYSRTTGAAVYLKTNNDGGEIDQLASVGDWPSAAPTGNTEYSGGLGSPHSCPYAVDPPFYVDEDNQGCSSSENECVYPGIQWGWDYSPYWLTETHHHRTMIGGQEVHNSYIGELVEQTGSTIEPKSFGTYALQFGDGHPGDYYVNDENFPIAACDADWVLEYPNRNTPEQDFSIYGLMDTYGKSYVNTGARISHLDMAWGSRVVHDGAFREPLELWTYTWDHTTKYNYFDHDNGDYTQGSFTASYGSYSTTKTLQLQNDDIVPNKIYEVEPNSVKLYTNISWLLDIGSGMTHRHGMLLDSFSNDQHNTFFACFIGHHLYLGNGTVNLTAKMQALLEGLQSTGLTEGPGPDFEETVNHSLRNIGII